MVSLELRAQVPHWQHSSERAYLCWNVELLANVGCIADDREGFDGKVLGMRAREAYSHLGIDLCHSLQQLRKSYT